MTSVDVRLALFGLVVFALFWILINFIEGVEAKDAKKRRKRDVIEEGWLLSSPTFKANRVIRSHDWQPTARIVSSSEGTWHGWRCECGAQAWQSSLYQEKPNETPRGERPCER